MPDADSCPRCSQHRVPDAADSKLLCNFFTRLVPLLEWPVSEHYRQGHGIKHFNCFNSSFILHLTHKDVSCILPFLLLHFYIHILFYNIFFSLFACSTFPSSLLSLLCTVVRKIHSICIYIIPPVGPTLFLPKGPSWKGNWFIRQLFLSGRPPWEIQFFCYMHGFECK